MTTYNQPKIARASRGLIQASTKYTSFIPVPDRDLYRTAGGTVDKMPHPEARGVFDSNKSRHNLNKVGCLPKRSK